MNELLGQLGGLFLGAIPTAVLFAVVWFEYRMIVHGELVAVLSERRERTEGAMERARADIAACEARSAECEQQIREARLAIYKAQELQRQKQIEARAAAVSEAQKAARARAQLACEALNADVAKARGELHADVESLANQILQMVLKPVPAAESTAAR